MSSAETILPLPILCRSLLFLSLFFFFFFCLTDLARTSSTMLNRCGEIGCPCLVLGFSGKNKYVWFNYSTEITTVNSLGCNLADLFWCITIYVIHTQSWFMSLLFVARGFFFFYKQKTRLLLNMLLCNLFFSLNTAFHVSTYRCTF